MLTVAQCYAAPTTGWIKAMTIHSSGAITAHQGITGSSGRRLEEQADEHSDVIKEHGAAIKEHDAAINDLRRRRRLEEDASERIEKLEATNEKMAKRIEMLEAALEKLANNYITRA